MRPLLALLLVGCGSEWFSEDLDGDGVSVAEGDCFDNPEQVAANGLAASDIYPGNTNETFYDGVDENCDGLSDFDKDGDGRDSAEYGGQTQNGDDCWDDPDVIPEGFAALAGYYQPLAREVLPSAAEVWYDGVNSNCDEASDFDQDGDGYTSEWHADASGQKGEDCFDGETDVFDNPAGLEPERVSPGEAEIWYDGTDQDCDEQDDFDQDGDGYVLDDECDDTDAGVFPNGAVDVWYDGVDSDCDGASDFDQDGDGYDSDAYGGDDCNDDPAVDAIGINGYENLPAEAIYPAASDIPYDGIDADCAADGDFDADGDGQDADDILDEGGLFGTDCNDADGTIYNGAPETWYDGIDGDCSDGSDYDQDGDGFDSADFGVGTQDDCDDLRSTVNPIATETCADAADEDCDGSTNDPDATDCLAYFNDEDGDGYGALLDSQCLCEADGSYTAVGVTAANDDCDDESDDINPGILLEDCATGGDDNCDGETNEKDAPNCDSFYVDADADGYGTGSPECWCSASGVYEVANDDDCADDDAERKPGATETCDLEDDDCDGSIDESTTHYYLDADADGFGDVATESCDSTAGSVTVEGDCDDGDARVYPSAPELCDLQQNDCDASSWSDVEEEGIVSFEDEDGVWSDPTAAWAAGTAASPVLVVLDSGSYAVCPGTWYVSLTASTKITDVIAPYGALSTILDYAGGARTVVTATNSELYLEGFTITGGMGTTASSSTYGGGAMSFATTSTSVSTLTLQSCEVTGNLASYGAGVASYSYGDVVLLETDVHDNTASVAGGGLYIQKGDISCTDGGVFDNTASGAEGGGAWFGYTQGHVYSTNCDWTGNSPDDLAGTGTFFETVPDATYGAGATFTCGGNPGCGP